MEYTQFDEKELWKCIALVAQKVSGPSICASKRHLNAVKKKYENKKYLSVSTDLVDPDVRFVQYKGSRCPPPKKRRDSWPSSISLCLERRSTRNISHSIIWKLSFMLWSTLRVDLKIMHVWLCLEQSYHCVVASTFTNIDITFSQLNLTRKYDMMLRS